MKDIKSLFLAAKSSRNNKDVDAYSEAVESLMKRDSNGKFTEALDYLTQVEYIISSNIGLATLKEYVEGKQLPITFYDPIMKVLNECVKKCGWNGVDPTPFNEAIEMMENFHDKYSRCFLMFENYQDLLQEDYLKDSLTKSFVENLYKYGPVSVSDRLIQENQTEEILEFFSNKGLHSTPLSCQWLLEAVKDIDCSSERSQAAIAKISLNSLEGIFESVKARSNRLFRESVLTDNDNIMMEYSSEEIKVMEDLISFKEYMITCSESTEEALALQKEVYSIYEEFDGLVEEDVGNILPMLPSTGVTKPVQERGLGGTKRTGETPAFLATKHNLGYGEDDDVKKKDDTSESEVKLDDFRRPSADVTPTDSTKSTSDEITSTTPAKELTAEEKKQINYYYYNYHNSNNTTTGSYNKHLDDHSTGKRIHSDDKDSRNRTNHNPHPSKPEEKTEGAAAPWELNPFPIRPESFFESPNTLREDKGDYLKEAPGDADKKPVSDHPIKDLLTDVDREVVKKQQEVKKGVQNIENTGRAFIKPVKRTVQWVNNMVAHWKDMDETRIKEELADPRVRGNLFKAVKASIVGGSLFKAGLLLNPVFLFLSINRGLTKNKREERLAHEMIGEIKAEIEIIDMKIDTAKSQGDTKSAAQLMRLKNEINKKLIRVGAGPKYLRKKVSKMI